MYQSYVFDCDGVVLDSNKVKTDAFYKTAIPFGEEAAKALVDYHVVNGGISRYVKFAKFIDEMLPSTSAKPNLDDLLTTYANEVIAGLLSCKVVEGLHELRALSPDSRWLIVSGGDQAELRKVFAERGLAELFNGGIFGSPDTKDEILKRELLSGNIQQPALFLGDSRYDHVASSAAGLDFVFITQWSEFHQWPSYCAEHQLKTVESLTELTQKIV